MQVPDRMHFFHRPENTGIAITGCLHRITRYGLP